MKNEDRNALIGIIVSILAGIGIAWVGSQGSVEVFGVPLFALSVGLAFMIQFLAFIPSFILQTEKFYDLTGSFTYMSVTLMTSLLSGNTSARSYLLLGLTLIWTIRLGAFLFARIQRSGKDSRFDDIKPSFFRFLQAWTIQGLWVSLTLSAMLAAITSQTRRNLDIFALLGFIVWLFGFSIETIADQQKRKFRAVPGNKGKFIRSGLWSWSRHPNYFGEIILWAGVFVITIPVLSDWQWIGILSPIFVIFLLTRISGIPILEKSSDNRWGKQKEYQEYKEETSILIPFPPKKRKY